jgi:hypothetical protein
MAYRNQVGNNGVEDRFKNLTMEDVQTAIDILVYWMNKQQQAQQILSRFVPHGRTTAGDASMMGLNPEHIIGEIMRQKYQIEGKNTQTSQANYNTGDIPPEKLTEMQNLTAKYRVGAAKPINTTETKTEEK